MPIRFIVRNLELKHCDRSSWNGRSVQDHLTSSFRATLPSTQKLVPPENPRVVRFLHFQHQSELSGITPADGGEHEKAYCRSLVSVVDCLHEQLCPNNQ